FFSSRRRHTRFSRDWSSDVCSFDLVKDTDFTPGATLSNGGVYAVSTNAGNIADIADITSGNFPVFLGIAKSTSKLNLNPTAAGKIGRASCRERGYMEVGAVKLERKK